MTFGPFGASSDPVPLSHSAADNIPKADEIRTLVKDTWDTRIAKLRLSADSFVRQQEAHARVREICNTKRFTDAVVRVSSSHLSVLCK